MANFMPPGQTAPRNRSWILWLIALVVVAAGVFALGRWVFPATSAPEPPGGTSTSTPPSGEMATLHGPAKLENGVPSGYTRDQAGAATAAANAIQLQVAVAHGQADPETMQATWIASNADQPTREALSEGPNTTGDDQTNKLPATTRVMAFNDTAATVEVWVVSVGSTTGIGGGTLTAAKWSTVTCQLAWERGDWKVTSLKSVSGPQPGENSTGSNLPALTNGLYTFYIDE